MSCDCPIASSSEFSTTCDSPLVITTLNGMNGSRLRSSRIVCRIPRSSSAAIHASGAAPLHQISVLFLATQALLLLELDVETEAADFVAKHVEADGGSGLERVRALDHGLVDLRAAFDVVRLDREQFL